MEAEKLMKQALKEAQKAYEKEEVPIGAIIQARIKKVYIGAMDEKTGACGSVLNLFKDHKFNHEVQVEYGVLEKECKQILQDFFKMLRKKKSFKEEKE